MGPSATATAQWRASSSVNTASIQMQSHPDMGSLCSADDGYTWTNSGYEAIPGWGSPTIFFQCAHESCMVRKSVTLSVDGRRTVETVYRGIHNHPRSSEVLLREVLAPFQPNSQHALPDVTVEGASMRRASVGGAQLPCSTDNEEEGDSDGARANCDFTIEADTAERHVSAPPLRNTAHVPSDGNEQHVDTSHRSSKRRRARSKVWEEFTAVLSDGKIQGAECKHCKKHLSGNSSGGTSHLRRHLETCPAKPAPAQQLRSSSASLENNWTFDQDMSHELLTKALVSNFCPFSLTSSAYFRQFLAGIYPTCYREVSPGVLEEKLHIIFQNEKLKLKDKITLAPGSVFVSSKELYHDAKMFLCMMVHFIDREWKMNRKVIRYCYMGCPYNNFFLTFPGRESYCNWDDQSAHDILEKVIQDWSLEHKLLGIVSDRTLMLDDESILDLQLGLDKYMTCSPLRREKYNEILSQLHRPCFNPTEWLRIYCNLEAALQFNKILPNPEQMDSQSNPTKPSPEKLEAAENYCNLIRPMYHVFKVLSDPCNETLNVQHFQAMCSWRMGLRGSSVKSNIDQIFHDIQEKLELFDELWTNWCPWLSLAVVLDPRYKLGYVDRCFKQDFSSDAKSYISEVRAKIYGLFFRYSAHADQQRGEQARLEASDLQLGAQGQGSVQGISYNTEQSEHQETRELTAYLEGDLVPENVPFDILKWWKENASTYPTLAMIAQDILAIPGSSVSADFDDNDPRMYLFYSKMSPEVTEALICTQDWIKS